MLFVHHGAFWSGLQPVRGKHFEKLSTMIQGNLGLYSAHIPLDLHPIHGNNRALADLIELENLEIFGEYDGIKIGLKGSIPTISAENLAKKLEQKLGSTYELYYLTQHYHRAFLPKPNEIFLLPIILKLFFPHHPSHFVISRLF